MLIKFESTGSSAPFVMLDDDAKPLLLSMVQDGKLEGAVSGKHLIDALNNLEEALSEAALAAEEAEKTDSESPSDEYDAVARPVVDTGARAAPLLQMLHRALAEDASVMWLPE